MLKFSRYPYKHPWPLIQVHEFIWPRRPYESELSIKNAEIDQSFHSELLILFSILNHNHATLFARPGNPHSQPPTITITITTSTPFPSPSLFLPHISHPPALLIPRLRRTRPCAKPAYERRQTRRTPLIVIAIEVHFAVPVVVTRTSWQVVIVVIVVIILIVVIVLLVLLVIIVVVIIPGRDGAAALCGRRSGSSSSCCSSSGHDDRVSHGDERCGLGFGS